MSASELERLENRLSLRFAAEPPPQLRAQVLQQLDAARERERSVRLGASAAAGFSLLIALALLATSPPAEQGEFRTPAAAESPKLDTELGLDVREQQRMRLLLADARVRPIAPAMQAPRIDLLEKQ